MENLNFKITEHDIKNYLLEHRNDATIKNKEAMFVKYMKESKDITQEYLEMLMTKCNWDDRKIDGNYYDGRGYSKQEELPSFSNYLASIHNLDISGICHILIPTFGYYGFYKEEYYPVIASHIGFASIVKNVIGKTDEADYREYINSAVDDYYVARKVDRVSDLYYTMNMMIIMNKETCRKELATYSHIYGEEPVKQIRKIVRERM